MNDVLRACAGLSGEPLTIRSDGPPNYAGEEDRRILVEGGPGAFRALAEALLAMAEAVESDPAIREHGWHLVLGPREVPGLRMDPGHRLVLDCGGLNCGRGSRGA